MIIYSIATPAYISGGYKNGDNAIAGFTTQLTFETSYILTSPSKPLSSGIIRFFKYTSPDQPAVAYTVQIDPSKFVAHHTANNLLYYTPITETISAPSVVGKWDIKIILNDSDGNSASASLGSITVESPKWEKEITVNQAPPIVLSNGNAIIDDIKVYQWDADNASWSASYDTYYNQVETTDVQDESWTFKFTFNESQVSLDANNKLQVNPDVKLELAYKHYDVEESEMRSAFFSTTRNQNYSNGIYNEVFVSGVTNNPNYSSRAWWSAINNPLYFPDNNYSEVGSNDTAIIGLTKVGDYLAVIKQSKTTDTAIYLLYPTSFEEETTFAVKQGVQGVGALARYAFNILGSETLFLSPNGVMAIVPTQDEEHKVQNRSYFIDKKLLAEQKLADAYSFVHDGKYYLSMGDGHCYVLDGNQRNSWGNDRTNLVYECYYLENVPAKCFAKYDSKLLFSDGLNICGFTNGFTDAYDADGKTNVPVKAEWSTVFDDDGALHYYKTMQKKGNLVSILPNDVLFKEADIDEDTFNADKTLYYTFNGINYVNCTELSDYDSNETYYVRARSATKIFVRKDEKEPVEIERTFSYTSDIPSEMFLKKKFKKYKRLQFIIRNEEAEDFGIDEIVKSYTLGNYAKR